MDNLNSLTDRLLTGLLNIQADLILEKNLDLNLSHVQQCLTEINKAISLLHVNNQDASGLQRIGYQLYLLRDEILLAQAAQSNIS